LRCNHEPLLRRSGAELRQIFFESAQEILQSINEQALRLEKHPDDLEALRSLRRAVHTSKATRRPAVFANSAIWLTNSKTHWSARI